MLTLRAPADPFQAASTLKLWDVRALVDRCRHTGVFFEILLRTRYSAGESSDECQACQGRKHLCRCRGDDDHDSTAEQSNCDVGIAAPHCTAPTVEELHA